MNGLSNLVVTLACVTGLWVSAGAAAAEKASESGFVPMFDGKSLRGWSVKPAKAAKAWTVEGGMIVGDGDKGRSYLTFDRGARLEWIQRADETDMTAHNRAAELGTHRSLGDCSAQQSDSDRGRPKPAHPLGFGH